MIKTVLVTGIAGFIGSHLLEALLVEKYNVIGLEYSGMDKSRIEKYLDKIHLYYSDQDDLGNIFIKNKIDCVIHLATKYIKQHQSVDDIEAMVATNIQLPSKLCQLCVENKVKYFINTGTFFEYKTKKIPLKESDEKFAYNFYAGTKLAFGEILKYYADNNDLKVIDFKLFAPYGDRDNEKLMALLIKSLINGGDLEFSGGEQRWNYTYVKDIAKAYIDALKHFNKLGKFAGFNVGCSEVYSIRQIVEKLEKIAGKKLHIKWGTKPYLKNEIFYSNCDNSRIKKLLKWQPKYSINEGLKRTYLYYLARSKND